MRPDTRICCVKVVVVDFDHSVVVSCKTGEGLDKFSKIIDEIVYTVEPSLKKQPNNENNINKNIRIKTKKTI